MSYDPDDTIAAMATAPGGAARGMVRVSGPATAAVVTHCFKKGVRTIYAPAKNSSDPFCRRATAVAGQVLVRLDEAPPRPLPCDLFLWPTGRSYTRQPLAEFHTFGSPPLLRAVLEAACRAGARLAEPGEFTLRAFLAGRLDLTQAEAVLGVIDAQHADQLDVALRQLAGGLAGPLHRLRDELINTLAELEAGLDFAEEDIQFITSEELVARLEAVGVKISEIADQMTSRLASPTSCQVVLTGPPNVGKSSLFNALVERYGLTDRRVATAIVSDECGTTRDYLVTEIDLGGIRCELIDTAGLDDAPVGTIAAAAQSLARDRRSQAVIRAYCIDAPHSADCVVPHVELVIVTKIDLVRRPGDQSLPIWILNDPPAVITSSVTGEGLDVLRQVLVRLLTSDTASATTSCIAATADRCRDSLRLAAAAISLALDVTRSRGGDELVAAELRFSLAELGKVVGAIYTDDLLDRIFKAFCIGK